MKKSSNEIANEILTTSKELGWKCEVRRGILTIKKAIDGNDGFCRADAEYYSILGLLPQTAAGSTWGTDGGGMGALSAMRTGIFTMNKSGGSKRVLTALEKII